MSLPLISPKGPTESEEMRRRIQNTIDSAAVVLFMKGTPDSPACGFSARAAEALQRAGASFVSVNVLEGPGLRQELSSISKWPTIPQLFVRGELIGGADIITQLEESGELRGALGLE